MDRTERTGLGLSVAGHIALAVILSLGLFAASKPIIPKTQPIDIQIVDKVGLTDTVPNPSPTPPAAASTSTVSPGRKCVPARDQTEADADARAGPRGDSRSGGPKRHELDRRISAIVHSQQAPEPRLAERFAMISVQVITR